MRALASILAFALVSINAASQRPGTLDEVLRSHAVPTAGLSSESLWQVVQTYASSTTTARYTIAYHTVPQKSSALWIRSYDKLKHQWVSRSFDVGLDACLGSVESLEFIEDNWVATTHLNPSAECTLVFSSALDLKRTIYGWIVATTRSHFSLIQHSEVHFAPTHPVELSVFDHSRNTLVKIYPPQDDPLRNEFIEYLSSHRDLDWCRQNNSPCDPEKFGAELGEVCAGAESDSFAFYLNFSSEGYGASASEQREMMYVFRRSGDKWEYREFPKESAPYTLNDAVTPGNIAHVFGESQ